MEPGVPRSQTHSRACQLARAVRTSGKAVGGALMPPLAQQSFFGSNMKRQVLKTILFALPKVLDLTARRFPAYRDRLKERNLVAWIGLRDRQLRRLD